MSFLFGSKKKPEPKPDAHAGLAKMRDHVKQMEKREGLVESKVAAQQKAAKDCARAKNKQGAMMALKKKKLYETELQQLMNTRFQLEQQMIVVEQAIMGASTLNAVKVGASAMQQVSREMGGADTVVDVMEDATEAMEDQREVQEALATGFGDPFGIDEDDILAELEELEEEELDSQLVGMGAVPQQPVAVPQRQPAQPAAQPVDEEEAELERQMQQMMAA